MVGIHYALSFPMNTDGEGGWPGRRLLRSLAGESMAEARISQGKGASEPSELPSSSPRYGARAIQLDRL